MDIGLHLPPTDPPQTTFPPPHHTALLHNLVSPFEVVAAGQSHQRVLIQILKPVLFHEKYQVFIPGIFHLSIDHFTPTTKPL